MPKRYCGQVAIEMRVDDLPVPGRSICTCFISARDPECRGKSICAVCFPYVGFCRWEDLAQKALQRVYQIGLDSSQLELFQRAVFAGGVKDGRYVVRKTR